MSTIKDASSGPEPLAVARMHLGAAVNRSRAGLVFNTRERLQYARALTCTDYPDLSDRIDGVEGADVTSSEARKEMREIMQLIDAKQEFPEGLDYEH